LIEIGKLVRATRGRAKISQAKLAEEIGMARENIIRLEMGRANLTIETLVRIASGLGAELRVTLVRSRR
jgi:transcriptional regulator with XRE-family HTH domain